MADLTQELQERRTTNRKKIGRIQFLTHKNDILQAIERGFSKREIWELLSEKGHFTCSYNQFVLYCRELSFGVPNPQTPRNRQAASEKDHEPIRTRQKNNKKGFEYDPQTFNKRHLLEKG